MNSSKNKIIRDIQTSRKVCGKKCDMFTSLKPIVK